MSLFDERIVCVSADLVARTVECLGWGRGDGLLLEKLDKLASRANPGSEFAFFWESEVQGLVDYLLVLALSFEALFMPSLPDVLGEWQVVRASFGQQEVAAESREPEVLEEPALSLTDEERGLLELEEINFAHQLREGAPETLTQGNVMRLLRALAAARFEKQQMRGALTAIAGSIYPAGNGTPLVGLIFEVTKHALGDEKLEDGEEYENCTKYLVAIGSTYPAELKAQSKGGK
ncbi:MAG: hypothetical protein KF821_09080 [Anaerolineales bacterium]|nr:hypothetical protein [Anaerolineales bacterium]